MAISVAPELVCMVKILSSSILELIVVALNQQDMVKGILADGI
jgi:hypothetical protein